MSSKLIRILISISGLFILISCKGESPEILDRWWQLNLIEDLSTNQQYQSLSFFMSASDLDGEEDLDKIYIINDDESIVWTVPSEKWLTYPVLGSNWIGFNGFTAPDDGIFVEGNYRVLIIDLGGEKGEALFYLKNNISEKEFWDFPHINYNSTSITINTINPKFEIWFYDLDNLLIDKSKDMSMGQYEWNDLIANITNRAFSFSVYTEPESSQWGAITGPYFLNK